jgi:hypothetical protein
MKWLQNQTHATVYLNEQRDPFSDSTIKILILHIRYKMATETISSYRPFKWKKEAPFFGFLTDLSVVNW